MVSYTDFPPSEINSSSTYVAMRDGVRIAVQVLLPPLECASHALTAVVFMTRYGRRTRQDLISNPVRDELEFLRHGYAVICIDVRGSGASFGNRANFRPSEEFLNWEEVLDIREVFDWIVKQSWSNGRLLATGVSYPGNASELAQVHDHPALVAIAPRFTDYDLYTHLLFPGGAPNAAFALPWGALTALRDRTGLRTATNPNEDLSLRYVDGDDGTQYRAALRDHGGNVDFAAGFAATIFRDDYPPNDEMSRPAYWHSTNVKDLKTEINLGARPAFHWASWLDAGTAAGVLERFRLFSGPMRIKIGAWNHGATQDADPFTPADAPLHPSRKDQVSEIVAFFEDRLAGMPLLPEREIEYFTLGANSWRKSPVWPPVGIKDTDLFFHPDGVLAGKAAAGEQLPTTHQVDVSSTTGLHNRWSTQLEDIVDYGDMREADERRVTFTSQPMSGETEITGTPQMRLWMESDEPDGLVIAYLEAVGPDGRVTYLTEGSLRSIHRANPDHRTFSRQAALLMRPGEISELSFPMLPLSVALPKGTRLRIALSGADRDTFSLVPSGRRPTWRLYHGTGFASGVRLPLGSRECFTG